MKNYTDIWVKRGEKNTAPNKKPKPKQDQEFNWSRSTENRGYIMNIKK